MAASDEIIGLLESGNLEKAAQLTIDSMLELRQEPRVIYRVLDNAYRNNKETILAELIEHIQANGLLEREALIMTMRLAFRAQQYEKALDTIKALLSVAENDAEALRTGGRIGNIMQAPDLALQYWERLAEVAAGDPEAPLQAARLRARRGEFLEALDWGIRATALQPQAAEPLLIVARAGLDLGWPERCDEPLSRLYRLDKQRALATLCGLRTAVDVETAARVLAMMIGTSPNDLDLAAMADEAHHEWLSVGYDHELGCRDLDAAAHYRAARLLRPELPAPQQAIDRLLRYCMTSMREAFQSNDFGGVVQHASLATTIDPKSDEAWQMAGWGHLQLDDATAAVDAFHRYVELRPSSCCGWLDYARALNRSGDRAGAGEALGLAQELVVGADAETRGELEAAVTEVYAALVKDARGAYANGEIDIFAQCYRAAATINSAGTDLEPTKGLLIREMRDQLQRMWREHSDELTGQCRRFLEWMPNDVWALTVLGRTLMRLRDYKEALPVWESLVGLNPADAHFHLQSARCCRALRLKDKGLAAAEIALRLDPQLSEASEIAAVLEGLPAPV